MSLSVKAITTAAADHARSLGLFQNVNGHEPKSAPQNGLTAAVWGDQIGPVKASGLAATSARVVLMVRLYTNMLSDPQDAIDPAILDAADQLLAAYSGDFTLGGLVKSVDLLGSHGIPLGGRAGYINQDGKLFRVFTITVPVIVNDAWEQVA